VTTALLAPGAAGCVTFAGQATVGAWTSFTVTVNEQVEPAVELQLTVVVPTGKNEPEAGVQVIVPQEPEATGSG
jgi:hypothetical protein